ncbi:MAG: hypothetical protein PHH68_06810 [Candidatus Omnitrophica bacterium]|jgi:hypothetical protein|nr:hypothetical protein [Candidatus Omnitrophota bacterium]MDD5080013.1 hypothetical protein [Candidatus Omnitrophota bacterium]
MQKKCWLLLLLFLPAVCTICMAADNTSEMPVGQAPSVTTIVGSGAATLESVKYPEFYTYNAPGYETCGEHLKTLSGALKGNYSTFQVIPGLQTTFSIPAEYRSTSRILFTWTVRIETGRVTAVTVAPTFCADFFGTSYQRFTGGEVDTQLFINGRAMQPTATMTVPGTSTAEIYQEYHTPPPPPPPPPCWGCGCWPCGDPTLTGSCLIAPGDLGLAAFPASMQVDVRWFNKMGGFQAVSPDQMRELIITIIPQ